MAAIGKARGAALRGIREGKPWTQAQLAQAAGLSTRTIMRVEAGGEAGAETLMAVYAALDVSAPDLPEDDAPGDPEIPAGEPGRTDGPVPERGSRRMGHRFSGLPLSIGMEAWGRRLRVAGRFVLAGVVAAFLALGGALIGLQAAWSEVAPHRKAVDDADRMATVFARVAIINRMAVRYSGRVPADDPVRTWEPWGVLGGLDWSNCAAAGEGLLDVYYRLISVPWLGGRKCESRGLDMRIVSRDRIATEVVVGPADAGDLRLLVGGLTGDPSVSIRAVASVGAGDPGSADAWIDPRVAKLSFPEGGRPSVRVRLSEAAR